MRRYNLYLLLFLLCFSACHSGQQQASAGKDTAVSGDTPGIDTDGKNDTALQKDRQLILGRWVSEDDPKAGMDFRPDVYYSVYDGAATDTNTYTISHKSCEEGGPAAKQDDEFLKAVSSGDVFCYSISALDKSSLSLIFTGGNGSISTYHRAAQ